MIEDRSAAQK